MIDSCIRDFTTEKGIQQVPCIINREAKTFRTITNDVA
jgi:hypothetical protein